MSKLLKKITVLLFFLIVLTRAAFADPSDNWHWRNPLPQGNDLRAVTYGNGTFIAVGICGTILTSGDGVIWTTRASGTYNSLHGVTYGNGTFVAVGSYGTILQSDSYPVIKVSQPWINFDTVNLGNSSSRTITVSIAGIDTLNIGVLSITGANASQFSIRNDSCSGKALSSSDSADVDIVFSPASSGAKIANLTIPSNNAYNSPVTVSLQGYGFTTTPKGNLDTYSPGSTNRVDGNDLYVLSKAFGSNPKSPDWNQAADLDNSGIIDGVDLIILAANFGKKN